MTLMSLGISRRRQKHWHLVLVCLFKAIWRNYILRAPARTIQNVERVSLFNAAVKVQIWHLCLLKLPGVQSWPGLFWGFKASWRLMSYLALPPHQHSKKCKGWIVGHAPHSPNLFETVTMACGLLPVTLTRSYVNHLLTSTDIVITISLPVVLCFWLKASKLLTADKLQCRCIFFEEHYNGDTANSIVKISFSTISLGLKHRNRWAEISCFPPPRYYFGLKCCSLACLTILTRAL